MTPVIARRSYTQVGGMQVHYREAGDSNNPTILLLHQSPSHSVMYELLMQSLELRFHLLAPDTPGFGNSDPLPFDNVSVADYAQVLGDWLQILGCKPDFLFGHHTGAAIAVQLEYDHPGARAMVLSGPPLLDERQRSKLTSQAELIPTDESGQHLLQMWQRLRAEDPAAPLAITQREVLSALASGDAYQVSSRAVAEMDFADLLPSIDCPVLVFAGSEDPFVHSVEPTLEQLAQGSGAVLSGGERTYICERQTARIALLLTEFFQSHVTETPVVDRIDRVERATVKKIGDGEEGRR